MTKSMATTKRRSRDDIEQGRALKAWRVAAGLTQRAVAAVMLTDIANVSRMEKGRQAPSLRQLRAFAKLVGAEYRSPLPPPAPPP